MNWMVEIKKFKKINPLQTNLEKSNKKEQIKKIEKIHLMP